MDSKTTDAGASGPELPACLTGEQKARYPAIAAIVRKTAARLPRAADKTMEPGHVFDLHLAAARRRA
jgi:hypothetical protein